MEKELTTVPRYLFGRDPVMSLGTAKEYCPPNCPLRYEKEEGELLPKCHLAIQTGYLSAALVTMCEAHVPFMHCAVVQEASDHFNSEKK